MGYSSSYMHCNVENYVDIYTDTRAHAKSILHSALTAWNNLPEAVRSAETLTSFKQLLTLDTPKVP